MLQQPGVHNTSTLLEGQVCSRSHLEHNRPIRSNPLLPAHASSEYEPAPAHLFEAHPVSARTGYRNLNPGERYLTACKSPPSKAAADSLKPNHNLLLLVFLCTLKALAAQDCQIKLLMLQHEQACCAAGKVHQPVHHRGFVALHLAAPHKADEQNSFD